MLAPIPSEELVNNSEKCGISQIVHCNLEFLAGKHFSWLCCNPTTNPTPLSSDSDCQRKARIPPTCPFKTNQYTTDMSDPTHDPSGEEAARKLITLSQAAKLSGLSQGHLRLLAKNGQIWAEKLGRNWVTTEKSIRKYLAQDRRPGPKSKG